MGVAYKIKLASKARLHTVALPLDSDDIIEIEEE